MADTVVDTDWSGLEVLAYEVCLGLLGEASVGRLGFVDQGSPIILPVNFTMDGAAVVFRTGSGSKLSTAMMQRPVCFEIDSWDALSHTGWSVLAKGVADEVLDDSRIERLESLPVRPWARPDVRGHWVSILVEDVTGRRIVSGG